MFPTRKPLSAALESVQLFMAQIKAEAIQIKASSLAGPVGANQIIAYLGSLADHRDRLSELATTPGLAAYAQSQYAAPGLDVAAEFTATTAQIDAVRLWIMTNFPKAPTNELREKTFDANGRVQLNTFSTADLLTFRAQIDALLATID